MTGPGSELPRPSAPAAMRNPRLVAAVVVVLALLTGLVVGVFAAPRLMMMGRGGFGRRSSYGYGGRGSWGRGGPTDRMRQHFASELGLSTAQSAQVDSILTRSMTERQALDDSVRPRMRALVDSTRARIDRILTPEQRQKFEAMHAKSRSARGGEGDADQGRGPPPGAPGGSPPQGATRP